MQRTAGHRVHRGSGTHVEPPSTVKRKFQVDLKGWGGVLQEEGLGRANRQVWPSWFLSGRGGWWAALFVQALRHGGFEFEGLELQCRRRGTNKGFEAAK